MKPGWKTTEFWLSLLAMLVGALVSSGAFPSESVVLKIAGVIGTILGALGYTVTRASMKNTEASAKALQSPPKPPQ